MAKKKKHPEDQEAPDQLIQDKIESPDYSDDSIDATEPANREKIESQNADKKAASNHKKFDKFKH